MLAHISHHGDAGNAHGGGLGGIDGSGRNTQRNFGHAHAVVALRGIECNHYAALLAGRKRSGRELHTERSRGINRGKAQSVG